MITLEEVLAIVGALEAGPDMSVFDPKISFSDNGIDSLDLMSVFLAIEEKYEIKFADAEIEEIRSAVDLVETAKRKIGKPSD